MGAEAVFCIDEWSTALGKTTVYVGVNIFALPNASVAQKCCRQRPVFIVLRTAVNSECRRPSCIVDPTVLRQCKSVPFVKESTAYFLFTSKAGSTDHFHWFMDHIVGLFTSSLDSNSEKLRSLNTFSLWASCRANYSNMTVYVGVTIFALCFLSEC